MHLDTPTSESCLELRCPRCGALCYLTLPELEELARMEEPSDVERVEVHHVACGVAAVRTRARPNAETPWLDYARAQAYAAALDAAGLLDDVEVGQAGLFAEAQELEEVDRNGREP